MDKDGEGFRMTTGCKDGVVKTTKEALVYHFNFFSTLAHFWILGFTAMGWGTFPDFLGLWLLFLFLFLLFLFLFLTIIIFSAGRITVGFLCQALLMFLVCTR